MTLRKFILPIVLLACPAFSQTAIMGHHLGEDISQFLAEEPGLQSRIEPCRASEPKPLTPEQIRALPKQDVYAVGEQVFATVLNSSNTNFRVKLTRPPSRGELEDLAKQGMPIVIDKRMPDVIATCHSLLALSGSPVPTALLIRSLPNTSPHPVTWHFKEGTLSQIDIDFHGATFLEVASDISSKLQAKPNENKEINTPNLYGANLHVSRKATWLTHELYALLEDEEGLVDGQLHFSAITRAEYDAWIRLTARSSTLAN